MLAAKARSMVKRKLAIPLILLLGPVNAQKPESVAQLRGKVSTSQLPAFALDIDGREMTVSHDWLRPRIVLRNAETGELCEGSKGRGYRIRRDGSFTCDRVPAGRWQVLFRYNKPSRAGPSTTQTLPQSLLEVRLVPGKESEVEVSLESLLPTSVHGMVFLHGVRVKPESLGYQALWPNHHGKQKVFRGVHFFRRGFQREGGGYRFCGLPPGYYHFAMSVCGTDGKLRRFRTLEPVLLETGKERKLDLQFEHRVAKIRLVRPGGATPIAGRLVRVGTTADSFCVTDADGWFRVDPIRSLPLEVEVFEPGVKRTAVRSHTHRWRGRIEVKKGARKVSEFSLVVPTGK